MSNSKLRIYTAASLIGIAAILVSTPLIYALPKGHGPRGGTSGTAEEARCNAAYIQCTNGCETLRHDFERKLCESQCERALIACDEARRGKSAKAPSPSASPAKSKNANPEKTPSPKATRSPEKSNSTERPTPRMTPQKKTNKRR